MTTDTWNGLRYRVTGRGRPVLLIHGIGRSLSDWDDQHERLSDFYQVWSVDLPGFGASQPPPHGMRLEHLAHLMADFIRGMDIGPVHLGGNSLGGAVAMQLTADHPGLVSSLLLANSAGFGRGVSPVLRLASIPGVGERLLRPSRKGSQRSEHAMYHDPRFATPARVQRGFDLAQRPGGTEAFLDMLRSLGSVAGVKSGWRRALTPRVRATGIPTFIVWGDKDAVLPFRHLKRGARMLRAATHRFPNTGHGPQIEQADEFARLARKFWDGVDQGDSMSFSPESKKPRGLQPFQFGVGSAVITGAASGIGRATAMNLAERGNDLALVDRDKTGLDAVKAELTRQHPGLVITTHEVDLAQPVDFDGLAAAVAAEHHRLSLLINNAGVALNGTVDEISMADLDWVLAINLRAPIAMTKSFLPYLQRESGSHIVNVSSLYGLVAPAGQSAYAASKFGIRGFTLALQSELIPRGIGVSVVHPGGIATNIARNSRTGSLLGNEEAQRRRAQFARFLTMPPERAAAQIVDAVAQRRERVLITRKAVLVDVISRVMPVNHRHYLARQLHKTR